jgi:alkanesulfonate monooxygenase SsuD/methylene tetrahydromethanopterin reductase-like flavin-dependent oxidoreductase (luciferase family)
VAEFARTLTSIDLLSAGRGERLEELLDVLAEFWGSNPVVHNGRLLRVPESRVGLRPYTPSGPPVLLGGFVDLSYSSTSVEESLELAENILVLYKKG